MAKKDVTLAPVKGHVPATPRFDVVIDPAQGPSVLMKQMHDACSIFSRIEIAGRNVLFYIARIAVEIRDHEWYAPKYSSFTKFVEAEIVEKHRISSGGIWGQIGVCGALPEITIDQANEAGTKNLLLAARVKKREPTISTQKLIKDAITLQSDAFEEKYPESRDGRAPGYDVIRIVTNKTVSRKFKKWHGETDAAKALLWLIEKHPEGPPADL